MSNSITADVIVIGSGIVGSSTAYELAKRNYKVIVLEQSNTVGDGASSRNGAGVRMSARVSPESDLAKLAIHDIWPTLSEELDADTEYNKVGCIKVAITDSQVESLEKSRQTDIKAGLDEKLGYKWISGDEAREMCPCLSPNVIKAYFCPEDGVANPMVTTLAYYRKNRRMGVQYYTGQNVIALKKIRGKVRQAVTADGNVYEGDKIVLAAGFNSRRIAETVGLWIPFLKRVDECFITEPLPFMTSYRFSSGGVGGMYGHQTRHGSWIFGGNTEIERYELTYEGKARNTNKSTPNNARKAVRYFPALEHVKIVRWWAGWLDSMSDRLPIIEENPENPGLVLSCGYSGHGFGIGPAAGRVTAEIVAGEKTSVDVSALKYNRFKAKMS